MPNAVGDEAIFPDVGGGISANVNSPVTVGKITITSPDNVNIFGSSSITLNASSGDAEISFQSNNVHGLSAPLMLQDPLRFSGTGVNANVSSNISGSHGIRKVDGGRVRLIPSSSTFSGASFIDAGSFSVESPTALGASSSGTTINAGGTLTFFRNFAADLIVPEPLTLNGGVIDGGTFQTLIRLTGSIDVTTSGMIRVSEDAVGSAFELTGPLSGAGNLTIDPDSPVGGATLLISGANSMTGDTTIGAAADPDRTVRVGSVNAISSTSVYTVYEILDLQGNSSSLEGLAGNGEVALGGATLTFAGPTGQNFTGAISGTGNVVKQGGGTQILGGTNTYSGTTSIQNGTLQVNGQIGSGGPAGTVSISSGATLSGGGNVNAPISGSAGSSITATGNLLLGDSGTTSGFSTAGSLSVGSHTVTLRDSNLAVLGSSTSLAGGTLIAANGVSLSAGDLLAGNGTVSGAVSVNSGTVSPGVGAGAAQLTTGNVSFTTGSLNINVNGDGTAGVDYDQLEVNGTVNLGTATLNLSGAFVPASGTELTIIDNDGTLDPVTGTFAGLPEGAIVVFNGRPLQISYAGGDGNDVVLAFTADPILDLGNGDNDILVQLSGANLQVIVDFVIVMTVPIAVLNSLTLNGQGGDDTLTVDFAGGNPVPVGGLNFNGGLQGAMGDEVVLTGGGATTITHTFVNASDGSVNIDGSTIMYTGLEPVTDNMAADHRVFNFTSAMAETITLDASGALDNRIDSSQGELVDFTNPTDSLTINVGVGGGGGADTINVQGLDAAFDADLTINGGGDDAVNFQTAATDIGFGTLVAAAQTINVAAPVMTSGSGSISLTANRNIVVNSSISTVNGNLELIGNGMGTGPLPGVDVNNGSVSSVDGLITLRGTGAGTPAGTNFSGVRIHGNSSVASAGTGGSGGIVIDGTGAASGVSGLHGVVISGNSTIQSVDRSIQIMGQGGSGTADSQLGVIVSDTAQVLATGAGSIQIDGTGGAGTFNNWGVYLVNSASVASISGSLTIDGTGGPMGSFNVGTSVQQSAQITSTTGVVEVSGNTTTMNSPAVVLSVPGGSAALISSGGSIKLDGTATSDGSGVVIDAGLTLPIQATGNGTILIIGDGAGGQLGVTIGSPINSAAGDIAISSPDSVQLHSNGTVASTSGDVEVQAQGGFMLMVGSSAISTGGGVEISATGSITTLAITAGTNTAGGGTAAIKLDTDTGNVTVNGPLTATAAPGLNIDIDPVDVNVNADITATGDIDIVADNDVTVAAGVTIEADSDNLGGMSGGTLTILADFDDDVDDGTGGTLLGNVGSNLLGAIVFLAGDVGIVDNMTGKVDDAQIVADVDATLTGAAVAADDVLITALLGDVVIAATASAMAVDDVELDADGTVDIDGPITAGEDVEIQLGFLGQGSVFIDANITANGNVAMFPDESGADVLIGSGAIITSDADMSGGGSIDITANRDVIQGSGSLISNTGGISVLTFVGGVVIVSASSDGLNQFAPFALANASGAAALQIAAGSTATVTGLVATAGDVEVVAGSDHVYLGGIAAGANRVFVEALFGAIIDNNADAMNVTAGALALDADQGIGDGDAIEVDLTTLSAFNFTDGNIEVADIGANASPLTIGTVVDLFPGVNNQAADGDVILSNLSPIVVDDPVTAVGQIQLTSSDLVVMDSISSTGAGNIDLFSNNATRTFAIGSGAAVKGSGLTTGSAAYGLDDAELDLITTGGQRRVNGDSGTDLFNVNYGGSDTQPIYVLGLAGEDEFFVAPATTMPINLDGGSPSAPAMPGDTLHLDMSGTVAPVIVDTIGGYAISASTAVVSFAEMETLDLCDDSGEIDNADIGDLYVRSTNNRERITFTSWNDTGVKLRIDDLTLGTSTTYPQHFGLVAGAQMLQQILVYAQDGDDLVSIAGHVVDAGLNPIPVEFHGEDGNDYLTGANADDILVGGPGNDRVLGGEGNNLLFGDGNQFDMGGMLIELPTDGNDNISGRGGADALWGGGGNDQLFGSGGDDVLSGGSGNDLLDGGLGTDILRGGDGNDNLSGSYGDDVLLGGAGDDSLFGRQDNDILIGGTGADQIRGDDGSDLLVAGTSDQDSATDAALLALLAAWSSGGTNNLTGITGDGDRDDLQGGSGIDEFWAEILPDPALDYVRDAAPGESVNNEA
ncbi:MAG: autotransporter-associated beta strand repeat-containing protein [Pirellulaceae bacterium]|nr:autotransporter-associated beta strand repeat-containing protein [Pirellulaceae bacterium]